MVGHCTAPVRPANRPPTNTDKNAAPEACAGGKRLNRATRDLLILVLVVKPSERRSVPRRPWGEADNTIVCRRSPNRGWSPLETSIFPHRHARNVRQALRSIRGRITLSKERDTS